MRDHEREREPDREPPQQHRPELEEHHLVGDVEADQLDVSAWARDAVALALPDKILCREDCAGLCPTCGKNLNEEPHAHEEETVDPRWAVLEQLRDSS